MKILKYTGFGMVILLSLGMVQQATSYTSAQVTNKASVSIVAESENALIGIEVDDKVEINEEKEIFIPFTVYNNMNRPITHMNIVDSDKISIENGSQVISAGNNKDLKFKYTGDKPLSVTIRFEWVGGSATIDQSLTLNSSQINDLLKAAEEAEKKKVDDDKALKEDIVDNMIPIEEDKNEQEEQKEEQKEEKKIKTVEEKMPVEEEQKE